MILDYLFQSIIFDDILETLLIYTHNSITRGLDIFYVLQHYSQCSKKYLKLLGTDTTVAGRLIISYVRDDYCQYAIDCDI